MNNSSSTIALQEKKQIPKPLLAKRFLRGGTQLSDVIGQWQNYSQAVFNGKPIKQWSDATQKAFTVVKDDIVKNKYDLSINRYKEVVYEEEVYEAPKKILKKLKKLELDILKDLDELEGML